VQTDITVLIERAVPRLSMSACRPLAVLKLFHLRHSLERDLAGLIGRGLAVHKRALPEFLIHGDRPHQLGVAGLVEEFLLMLFAGNKARQCHADAEWLAGRYLSPHMRQHAGVLAFGEAAFLRPRSFFTAQPFYVNDKSMAVVAVVAQSLCRTDQ
jgi:hypothetical protein